MPPKPFVRTADPDRVLAAIKRGKQALEPIHWDPRLSCSVDGTGSGGVGFVQGWSRTDTFRLSSSDGL
jgi:hypothetical protein